MRTHGTKYFMIFKESVNNIVRHSQCTQADIEFKIEQSWLVLKLSDNGRGFETRQRRRWKRSFEYAPTGEKPRRGTCPYLVSRHRHNRDVSSAA